MVKPLVSRTHARRAAVLVTALATATGIALYAGAADAGAASTPSIKQVQAQVNNLQGQVDKLGQEYDAAGQQLSTARAQLAQVTKQADKAQQQYNQASATLAAVAVTQYENSGSTSIVGLLTSGNPDEVLSQASLVLQVENNHNEQAQQLLTLAQELSAVKAQRQHTESGVEQLTAQYAAQKQSMTTLLDKQTSLLGSLTAAQQSEVQAQEVGGPSTSATTSATYTGPTSTQADQAVAFAYNQLGKPYVYGATGPGSYDCSGLVQAAWANAGVSIPRDTYEQWAGLPHIPMSDLEPGDLILYNGESHVAMYVGNGYIIDAPHTGAFVEKVSESISWYADNADGALRP